MLLYSVVCAREPSRPLERAQIREAVESLATKVDKEYFDTETAEKLSQRLREELAQAQYDEVASLEELA
jgi:hypothetical protein